MEKRILFVETKESFISRAICDNLRNSGFEVECIEANISKISKLDKIPDLIFVNLDEEVKSNTELIVYLKDHCVETDKLMFFTGYTADIDNVLQKIPTSIFGMRFDRPVNTKEIGQQINQKFEEEGTEVNKKHILVVDDSGTFLHTIKGWLSPKYRVSMVSSAANAISFLSINKPDLILLDYEMPVCSGPQMLEMIRAEVDMNDVPVMFLTSKDDIESVSRVLALRPQGYLLKTLKPEQIIEAVDKYFAVEKARK